MPRFVARLQIEVRSTVTADPGPPAAPWKLEAFDNTPDSELGVPLFVTARYRASRDVNATDALDAMGKLQTFANANVPALIPAGGRLVCVRGEVKEWPT